MFDFEGMFTVSKRAEEVGFLVLSFLCEPEGLGMAYITAVHKPLHITAKCMQAPLGGWCGYGCEVRGFVYGCDKGFVYGCDVRGFVYGCDVRGFVYGCDVRGFVYGCDVEGVCVWL